MSKVKDSMADDLDDQLSSCESLDPIDDGPLYPDDMSYSDMSYKAKIYRHNELPF